MPKVFTYVLAYSVGTFYFVDLIYVPILTNKPKFAELVIKTKGVEKSTPSCFI